jgi:hypothetical protein
LASLVSRWAVDPQAATRLAIATFDRLKSNPKIGRLEALRQAMLGYLNDTSSAKKRLSRVLGSICPDQQRSGPPAISDCAPQKSSDASLAGIAADC